MPKTAKQHLILIALSTFLAGFSLASVINFTDPYTSGVITHIFLYISLFLTTLGIWVLVGLAIRQMFFSGLYITHLNNSFRQGFLLSVFITVSLGLQAQGLLFWWIEGSFILLLAFFEVFLNLKT